jgi:hypothetical protein
MAPDCEIEQVIARCVGIMVFYRNRGKTTESKAQMAAEIRAVARSVKRWHFDDDVIERILDSVKTEMIARFGHELGVRLDDEFYVAFTGEATPVPMRLPSMARC